MPHKVTGTCWLPHLKQGIPILLRNFTSYNAHISDASYTNAKAEGLVKIMTDEHVLTFALFMQVQIFGKNFHFQTKRIFQL